MSETNASNDRQAAGRAKWFLVLALAFVVFGSASALAAVLVTRDTTTVCEDVVPGRPVSSCLTGVPNTTAVVAFGLLGGTAGAVAAGLLLSRRRPSGEPDDPAGRTPP
ncbi:MAG TPA: hypothetical protein VHF47_08740 [Acidimicrobiales bacterium]|nr:hypothetical protein [Acidimicrobiales bacterium]